MATSPLILLIDGNQEDRDYYTQLLRTFSTDIVVLHAPTGHSGLALCKRQSIDCVVLEINLPDMSGYEVLRQLIPFTPDPGIAVIVLTRISDHHLLETAIRYGAQATLCKTTITGDLLARAVHNAITTIQDRKRLHAI